uniref:Carbonic anhydrase n=1 Tax=Timema genevievae TaxID=629358 RepID=A0A7R9JRP7_TIMGE|nr:unnamed protein product [Timema genevievae]
MKIPNFQTEGLIRAIIVLGMVTKFQGLLVDALDFGYNEENGPDTWPSIAPNNIPTAQVAVVDFPPLSYDGFWGARKKATITNNGHSAEVSIKSDLPIILNGGPLTEGYTFQQLHFHWGSESTLGSEHTINGRHYSMEVHLVHYKSSYGSLQNASNFQDGLAVVAFFLQTYSDLQKNTGFEYLAKAVQSITEVGSSASMNHLSITRRLHEKSWSGGYYTYNGSLTTPSCNEVVTWIVYPQYIPISEKQVDVFRQLKTKEGDQMVQNFRPVQPLNDREIYYATSDLNIDTLYHFREGYSRVI